MTKNTIILIIAFFTLLACQEKRETKLSGIENAVVENEIEIFDQNEIFKLTKVLKSNDYPSSDKDTTICIGWTLTESAIEQIIKDSKPISGPEWHHQFGHFPCRIHGKLLQDSKEYEFSINSGSWLTVSSTDTTLIFGSFKEENNRYFLSSAWTVEDMDEKE